MSVEASLYSHGWLNHRPLVIHSAPSIFPLFGGGRKWEWDSNPLVTWLVLLAITPYLSGLSKSHFKLRNTRVWMKGLWWITKGSLGFPGGTSGKEPTCQCRRLRGAGFIPGSGRSSGEGHGNPLQYSCLENSVDREAWRAIVHRVAKSRTWLRWLSTHADTFILSFLGSCKGCRVSMPGTGMKTKYIFLTINHNMIKLNSEHKL